MINQDDLVDINNVDLMSNQIGGTWTDFLESTDEYFAHILRRAFNLILLTDLESYLPINITNILVDETTDISNKKSLVYNLATDTLINILVDMGFRINEDYVDEKTLPILILILDLIYSLDGYEDLQDISLILENTDLDQVDRFIAVYEKYNSTDEHSDDLSYLLEGISENVLLNIKNSLIHPDLVGEKPVETIDRINKYKPFLLTTTLAKTHLINDGELAIGINILLNMFEKDLEQLSSFDKEKEFLGLLLISDCNNSEIFNRFSNSYKESSLSLNELMTLESLIDFDELKGE